MTVFLTVIDRKAASQDAEIWGAERLKNLLERTGHLYQSFLGSDYNANPFIQSATRRHDVYVMHWERSSTPGSLTNDGRFWAISSGHNVDQEIVDKVRPRGGRLQYVQPVWGQYAAVFGSNNSSQVFAWNTTPALEAVHWASTHEYVVISNRPLLAAFYLATLEDSGEPTLSTDYLPEYLFYGYSVTGQTPFRGVHTLSVNSALPIIKGTVAIIPRPSGLESSLSTEHTLDEGAEALAAALKHSMDRTEYQIADRPLQLRLSGGKDSRLLLGLLRGRDIDYRAVTFGNLNDVDVKLASRLCELVGRDGEVRAPRPAYGDSIPARIASTLRESGGMPASEPHTAQYQGADPQVKGEAIMMGQWPLYKGGMARRLRMTREQVDQKLKEQGGNLVNNESRVLFDSHLLKWSDELVLNHEIEKLYLFAREFRSGRYLHAHIDQYSSSSMIAYPIADAEVTAVCDALTLEEKVTEKALFGALQCIWPEVMGVPLDRSKWKFELGGPDPDLSGRWYSERYANVPDSVPAVQTAVKPVVREYSDEAVFEMARHIVKSRNFDMLSTYLSDEMLDALESASNCSIILPSEMGKRMFTKFVWRICVADIWLDGSWLY